MRLLLWGTKLISLTIIRANRYSRSKMLVISDIWEWCKFRWALLKACRNILPKMTFWLRVHNWAIKTRSTWSNLMHRIIAWCQLKILWLNLLRVLIGRVEAHMIFLSNKCCIRVIIDLVQKWADKINSHRKKCWANHRRHSKMRFSSNNIIVNNSCL